MKLLPCARRSSNAGDSCDSYRVGWGAKKIRTTNKIISTLTNAMEKTVWEHYRGWYGRKSNGITEGDKQGLAERRLFGLDLNGEEEEAM